MLSESALGWYYLMVVTCFSGLVEWYVHCLGYVEVTCIGGGLGPRNPAVDRLRCAGLVASPCGWLGCGFDGQTAD